MQEDWRQAEDALTAIDNCTTLDDAPAILDRIARGLGYDGVCYSDTRLSRDETMLPFFQTTVAKDFAVTYQTGGFFQHDPMIARASWLNTPFSWDTVPEFHQTRLGQRGRGRPRKSLEVMHLAHEYGFTQGAIFPVHALDQAGRPASSMVACFWREKPEELTASGMPRWFQIATMAFHERVLKLRNIGGDAAPLPVLTDRERDVMLWTARGKTRDEIATILGLSDETVKDYLARAMAKLGARNKFHAIALGVQKGLIML